MVSAMTSSRPGVHAIGRTADDVNSWQRTASRAAHPSAVGTMLEAGDLLLEIAAGLGRVTVPGELADRPVTRFSRELVPPHTPRRLSSTTHTTTVHVHATDPQ